MRIGGGVSVRRIVGIGLLMVVAAGCVGSGPSATASELALASPNITSVQRQRFRARLEEIRDWLREQRLTRGGAAQQRQGGGNFAP